MSINIEASWKAVLSDEFEKPYFIKLTTQVKDSYAQNRGSIFPKRTEIFRAFELCTFPNTKVVILGQDPYPTRGHAHGFSFSVNDEVKPFPKSLNNIFKEITSDLGKPVPENGNLTRWARQGVLLLNTVLTVEEGKPDSHKGMGWESFTDRVIERLSSEKENIVFLLWGAKAAVKEQWIDSSKHLVLKSVHPSPLSAYRGFFGCKHFSQANSYLSGNQLPSIEW
jgi:uracil-DNA glycosylase